MRRLFLAVPVPPEVPAYREQLKEENIHINGIKWMRLHNLHLTGYFIGNVDEEKVDEVMALVRPVISAYHSFSIEFGSVAFAPSRDPQMIWLRFNQSAYFSAISNSIHEALAPLIPVNKFHYREPVPHITLARFHNKVYRQDRINLPAFTLPPLRITGFELWESLPSAEGVKYQSVESIPFSR
jgi:RNA 2',3'-cyclic 3'-phosphodiesterase